MEYSLDKNPVKAENSCQKQRLGMDARFACYFLFLDVTMHSLCMHCNEECCSPDALDFPETSLCTPWSFEASPFDVLYWTLPWSYQEIKSPVKDIPSHPRSIVHVRAVIKPHPLMNQDCMYNLYSLYTENLIDWICFGIWNYYVLIFVGNWQETPSNKFQLGVIWCSIKLNYGSPSANLEINSVGCRALLLSRWEGCEGLYGIRYQMMPCMCHAQISEGTAIKLSYWKKPFICNVVQICLAFTKQSYCHWRERVLLWIPRQKRVNFSLSHAICCESCWLEPIIYSYSSYCIPGRRHTRIRRMPCRIHITAHAQY